MRLFYGDYHIHSALSPCAENDMTPYNIIAMAHLKGLDFIAVSDHNSALNLRSVIKHACEFDICVVPAIEVSSKEDVHIVCYFPNIFACEEYSKYIYELLPDIECVGSIFGEQLVFNENDEICSTLKKLLVSSIDRRVDQIFSDVYDLGGVPVFAHVDRQYNGVLSVLGFIPPNLKVTTIEITKNFTEENPLSKSVIGKYQYLRSSDAHTLGNINERVFSLELEEKTVDCFLRYLMQK